MPIGRADLLNRHHVTADIYSRIASYGGNGGPYITDDNPANPVVTASTVIQQERGVICALQPYGINDISDGTSNTMLLIESQYGAQCPQGSGGAHWWVQAIPGQTFFTTYYPMNPPVSPQNDDCPNSAYGYINSAGGSFHPGGANFGFADGSVHFLKQSIACWPMIHNSSNQYVTPWVTVSQGGTGGGIGPDASWSYSLPIGQNLPVYQALSTRDGGEVISSDAY